MALRRFLILNRDRYDAILVSFLKYEAMLSGWMRQRLNVPVVARAEGAGQGAGDIHVLSTLWSGRLIASGIRRVDRLVAISRRAAAQIEGAGFDPTRIVTIPNGVDCEKYRPSGCGDKRMESRRAFDPAILPESPVLLALGRLIPVKGLDVLLRALAPRSENAEDRLKSLPWRLWIAGDGPQRAPLGELAESLGLTARVRFLGQVENTPDLLRAADVFVQPSHGEGLSLALLEAMASGLAVVASRVSGSEDRIRPGENGLLVEPGDEGGLRHALIEVLHAPRLRARLGAGARLDAETNCAFPRVARQYAELFRQLASPGTRTS